MWTMARRATALAIAIALVGCAHRSSTQTQAVPVQKAVVDEADHLDEAVGTLYDKGKFQEAIPLAERSLSLREKALDLTTPMSLPASTTSRPSTKRKARTRVPSRSWSVRSRSGRRARERIRRTGASLPRDTRV
jgi:hypothetical protein